MASGKQETIQCRLMDLLREQPTLRRAFETLCNHIERRGGLRGTRTVGRLNPEARRALTSFLGGCLRESPRLGLRIDLDRLAESLQDEPTRAAWMDAVFAVLERQRHNLPAERTAREHALRSVLASWTLAFPELPGVARYLQEQTTRLMKLIEQQGAEALRARLQAAAETVKALRTDSMPVGLSELGARHWGDSKCLRRGELRNLICDWLLVEEGREPGDPKSRDDALRQYGVCDNPTAAKVTLFGPLHYWRGGRRFTWISDLHALGESATLSWDNLKHIERFEPETAAGNVITCENETPFCRLVSEKAKGVLVYTEGYPNTAVRHVLRLLPRRMPRHHWGDSDLDGLRIAAILNQIQTVSLWRCERQELERLRQWLTPLDHDAALRARLFRDQHPDFPYLSELDFTIAHGWLEQESWTP